MVIRSRIRQHGCQWLLLALFLLLIGCTEVGYYAQAMSGQWQLMQARKPVTQLLADPETEPQLRQRLQIAENVRGFASAELGLPDNGSYRSYADLQRPYAVYNVFASKALSLDPYQWCFPLIGCVSYRGFFDEAVAERLADDLRTRGYDVYVAGIPAYSTLGYFDDPLLNTFIQWSAGRIAELVFHELSHQQLYIADDTVFNESFATFIGQLGAHRWLNCHGSPDERRQYANFQQRREEFMTLVLAAKEELNTLYASGQSDTAKQTGKQQIFSALRDRYEMLKVQEWGGFAGYDNWFEELNNAKLAALATYTRYVPAFAALFAELDRDFSAFYDAVAAVAKLPQDRREQRLQALTPEGLISAVPLYDTCCSGQCATSSRQSSQA